MQKDSADFGRKNARGLAILNAVVDGQSGDAKHQRFHEITTQGPRARIHFRDTLLDITAVGSDIIFSDNQGQFLSTAQNGSVITLVDPRYQNWQMVREAYGPHKVLRLNIETFHIPLVLAEDDIRVLAFGNIYPSEAPKTAWQPSLIDHLFSARLYIWNRTLPLVKDAIFLGHGPGVFPILFPQRDFVGKINAYNVHGIIVDKPHSLFLQQWFQSGLLHMLIFLGMALAILHKTWHSKEPIVQGLAAGIVGYLVAGLANDSVVAVAPTFWIFLGILAAHSKSSSQTLRPPSDESPRCDRNQPSWHPS